MKYTVTGIRSMDPCLCEDVFVEHIEAPDVERAIQIATLNQLRENGNAQRTAVLHVFKGHLTDENHIPRILTDTLNEMPLEDMPLLVGLNVALEGYAKARLVGGPKPEAFYMKYGS